MYGPQREANHRAYCSVWRTSITPRVYHMGYDQRQRRDPDARREGTDVHTLRIPEITRLQEAYVDQSWRPWETKTTTSGRSRTRPPGSPSPWQYNLARWMRMRGGRGRGGR